MKTILLALLLLSSSLIAQEEMKPEPTLTNEQVLNNVQELLKSAYSKYNIQVHIYDGVVTLVGRVGSEEDKYSIEKHVSKMSGVKRVYNHLHVATSQPPPKAL